MGKNSKSTDDESKPTVAKSALDLQRFKLEKLMKNPEKPIIIPDRPKDKKMPHVPEFVRNVMGSSAGAGSGEFHVYRHLRRKEYARQKFIQEKSEKQLLEEGYHQKLLDNKQAADEKTAKKRAKRLRKKANKKVKKQNPSNDKRGYKSETESEPESEDASEENLSKDADSNTKLTDNKPVAGDCSINISKSENNGLKRVDNTELKDELTKTADHEEEVDSSKTILDSAAAREALCTK